jgi:cell fate (sporulation/competence/biofilm development) regulator YmcA (YheA/YmcA/DUF963 family)
MQEILYRSKLWGGTIHDMVDRNELLAQANEIAEILLDAPEIAAYRAADQQLRANPQTEAKIRKLRELTDQVGDFKARNVPFKHYQNLVIESEKLMNELQSIPEVHVFQETQAAINELLESVTSRLARGVMIRLENEHNKE